MIFDEVREILAEQLDVDKDSIEMNSKLARISVRIRSTQLIL